MKKIYKFLALSLLTLVGYNANAQLTYAEDFETGLGGWSGTYSTTTNTPCEASQSVRDNIYTSSGGNFTSGLLGTSNGGLVTFNFTYKIIDYSGGGATPTSFGTTDVQFASSASGPWTTGFTIDASNHTPSASCATLSPTFVVTSGDTYIRFNTTYGTGDYYFYIDDISISQSSPPSCPQPSALMTSAVTSSSVDAAWTTGGASNWNIEYGPTGFAQGSGTFVYDAANPFTISPLTPNTAYDVYVQDSCGQGDVSTWIMTSVTTFPNMHAFPLTEDFEDNTLFFEDMASATPWVLTDALAHTGTYSMFNGYGANENNILHETGILDLSATGTPVLEFWHIAKTEGNYDECYVEISINGGQTYTTIPSSAYRGAGNYTSNFWEDSYSAWGTGMETPDNSWWKKETFDLSAYNVADVRVRFRLSSDGSGQRAGWYIDDLTIFEPTCPLPYALTNAYQNEDSVVLSWTAGNQETMWNVEYGMIGFTQGSGTMQSGLTSTTDTIDGLALGSVYQFFVQADCGGGDASDWVGPITIATPIQNDSACQAIAITVDGATNVFSNIGATIETGESALNGDQYNTVWFTAVVPASGHMIIATCGSENNTVVGAYDNDTIICDSMEMFGQIAYASAYTSSSSALCGAYGNGSVYVCGATPGSSVIFYVGTSSASSSNEGIINVIVVDASLEDYAGQGAAMPVSACAGDTVDLWSNLTGQLTNNGTWKYPSNTAAIVNDTTVNTGAFSLVGNEVYYIVANTCDADTATVVINAQTATNTGTALANYTECNAGDVFLFNGLTGTVDAGGTWSDDLGTNLLVNNKFVASGVTPAPYQFTYTVSSGVCPPASTQITVNIVDCTDITEEGEANFTIYPNPNNGTFFISNGGNASTVAMEVVDVQGKVVYTNSFNLTAGAQQEISLGNVETGVYLVRVITNNKVINNTVIVK